MAGRHPAGRAPFSLYRPRRRPDPTEGRFDRASRWNHGDRRVRVNATFADGHLFFVHDGHLMTQPFDAEAQRLKGSPLSLGVPARVDAPYQRGMFSVASTGRLVYRPTAQTPSQLTSARSPGPSARRSRRSGGDGQSPT